ncbi:cell division protein FtsL [Coxiella endosymbiont of Rhipicephalus microplus]|uniref:cell division protein FtsL n=1 Tax=Coxiella endosymbiont of Rhipicephalus microplus TaxID=1656186 RepID=UPI000C8097CE|nr:cell division protein FtsL [Coxiella endosymbiont of Rhipicephalus microplus]PMB54344.1 Cell division protein FtsL [Coxiella-like endosymbiont]
MNTATRVIIVESLRRRHRTFQVTKGRILVVSLVIALLSSAFGIVYVKDLNRRLFIQYQILQREKAEELIQWGKFLLEQSTWSTQSRIQQVAQKQLGMQIPTVKEVVLINGYNTNVTLR